MLACNPLAPLLIMMSIPVVTDGTVGLFVAFAGHLSSLIPHVT
jgi:hypothetical protein